MKKEATAMPTLLIYADVRRIGPAYQDGRTHFSMNVTVAFEESASGTMVRGYLRPWLWDWRGLRVCDLDTMQEVPGVVMVPAPETEVAALHQAFERRLADIYKPDTHPERFIPGAPGASVTLQENWMAFVAQQSTLPAPLPHALKLVVLFSLPTDQLPRRIIAAPILHAPAFGAPQGPPTALADPQGAGIWTWSYPSIGNVAAAKLLEAECLTGSTPKLGRFDLGSLWVDPPTRPPPAKDWITDLEHRLPDWLDLANAFLAYLDHLIEAGARHLPRNFYRGFFALLEDTGGHGLALGPSRSSLAAVVLSKGEIDVATTAHARLGMADWRARVAALYARRWGEPFALAEEPPPDQSVEELRTVRSRLGRIRGLLSDDAVLRGHVSALWNVEPGSEACARLQELPLHRLQIIGNAGIAWRGLAAAMTRAGAQTPAAVTDLVVAQVLRYLDVRMLQTADAEYASYRPLVDPVEPGDVSYRSLRAWIAQHVRDHAMVSLDLAMTGRRPSRRAGSDVPSPMLSPDGIVLQVDDLGAHLDEVRAAVNGVGLLLRKVDPAEPWCCLNLATLHAQGADALYAMLDASPTAVVPQGVSLRNGLPQLFIEYQAHPLAARSPASDLMRNRALRPPKDDRSTPALLQYENPYQTGGKRLPALGFGWSYEAAVFAVANGGTLPMAIVASANAPWEVADAPAPPASATWPLIPLRRRVPVGSVGLAEVSKDAGRPLPERVFPIARALHLLDETTTHRANRLYLLVPDERDDLGESVFRPDLVLTSIDLAIGSPTIDLPTWDRWVQRKRTPAASADEIKARRTAAWAGFHRVTDLAEGDDRGAQGRLKDAAAIDDPAVVGVTVSMKRVFSITATPSDRDLGSVDQPLTYDERVRGKFAYEKRAALPLQVKVGAAAEEGLRRLGGGFQAFVVAGAVYEISITPTLDESGTWFAERPDPPAVTFFVEVPGRFASGAGARLRSRLGAAPSEGATSVAAGAFRVALDCSVPSPEDSLLHRAEIILQRWRWDGKPVAYYSRVGQDLVRHDGFPVETLAGGNEAAASLCDETLFASRSVDDAEFAPAICDLLARAATASPTLILHDHPLGTAHGAMYFRIGVRFWSRYEGLLAKGARVDTRGEHDAWLRSLVPAAVSREVPSPAVRLIIPLTASGSDASGSAAGLLVILDEEWFAESGRRGGVAESLEAEIVEVDLPDRSGRRRQLGKDPIIDTTPVATRAWTIEPRPLVGPVGFTFDTEGDAPLFAHTSFVVEPPRVTDAETGLPVDMARFFIQLRFRRRLHDLAATGRLPEERTSLWTGACWSQFLAASDRQRVLQETEDVLVDTSDLGLARAGDGTTEIVQRSNRKAVEPVPSSVPAEGRDETCIRLYALVTRRVIDAFGRKGQEIFLQIAELRSGVVPFAFDPDLSVRLVEILFRRDARPDKLDGWKALAEHLFPSDGGEASAQIIRVTPPIALLP
jgi:hypothetical protein